MTETRRNPALALLVLAFAVAVLMSAAVHPEASVVIDAIDSGLAKRPCSTGLYISPVRGTLLAIADLGNGQQGGQIIRFFEYKYNELRPVGRIYECTAFQACGSYWCRVIKRDGFVKLIDARTGWAFGIGIFTALGALGTWLRFRGRYALADEVDPPTE